MYKCYFCTQNGKCIAIIYNKAHTIFTSAFLRGFSITASIHYE